MTEIDNAERPSRLSVVHNMLGDVRVVTVQGEIDHDIKDALSQALLPQDAAAAPPRIVADFRGVTFMDSTGINVLVAAHQHASDAQGWLRLAGVQEPVLQVLRIVGLDTLIDLHPTVEQALDA
ncbi:STAS domain-containing protein [Streptomyces sp. LUP30]|uniref:STAS domain-containing protein n=1 Tax=Streptomyces sp. LUP30 TaxID=1890285 RepID=UPI0008520031|nr:STAS domain-containing protein [Streptomyces sp. LUP30]